MAYAADLKNSLDQWVGKASGDQGLISAHNAIIAEQNRHPVKSSAWRVLHAAENVIGDQKINLRPSARVPAQKPDQIEAEARFAHSMLSTLTARRTGLPDRGFVDRSCELG